MDTVADLFAREPVVPVCATCQAAAETGHAPADHGCGPTVGSYGPSRGSALTLIGRTILSVLVGPGEAALYFVTDHGVIRWQAEADCCSETWFADITGFDALRGSVVIGMRDLSLPTGDDGRTRQEEDSFYGVEITTWRGRCHIAYRNSSNGYYGGWMNCGEVAEVPADAREIHDDWSA